MIAFGYALRQLRQARAKIPLAFIFSIRIMRALPQLEKSILALAALVHRFLTYLSRECSSRLSKKLIKKFWVFRLATMFYAPVNLLPV